MPNDESHVGLKEYIDTHVNYIRALKTREREDILRDFDRFEERFEKFEQDVNSRMSNLTKLVYIGLGIVIAIQFATAFFKK